jgi:2-hydroxychromene-2-carboxylate isomerase
MRIADTAGARGVTVRWRPFLLGPIFKAQGWDNSPFNLYPAKGRYMWRDLERICDALALPFHRPAMFPQNTIPASRVALVGLARGWGEDFCRAVYAAEFGEGRNIGEADAIVSVLTQLGQDAKAVTSEAQNDAVKNDLRAQTDEAARLGIFGAPSFGTGDGELFWGNDRLEAAIEWAKRH